MLVFISSFISQNMQWHLQEYIISINGTGQALMYTVSVALRAEAESLERMGSPERIWAMVLVNDETEKK